MEIIKKCEWCGGLPPTTQMETTVEINENDRLTKMIVRRSEICNHCRDELRASPCPPQVVFAAAAQEAKVSPRRLCGWCGTANPKFKVKILQEGGGLSVDMSRGGCGRRGRRRGGDEWQCTRHTEICVNCKNTVFGSETQFEGRMGEMRWV